MDLSFSRLPPSARAVVPPRDAAALLAMLAGYRTLSHGIDRCLLAPADGAFNGRVARLLTGWQV